MRYFLSRHFALKHLERESVYNMKSDELYELDAEAFGYLLECSTEQGSEAAQDSDFMRFCLDEGILTASKVDVKRPPVIKPPEPSLRYLELQVTRKCNLRCRHCFLGPSENTELPIEDIERVLLELQRMQGLRVLVTGGEPLLHSGFRELNSMLPRFALRKVLLTNGTLLDGEVLSGLKFDEIQVSLDGMREAHDSLRGKGSFEKALSCMEGAIQLGLDVSVSTMVHRNNTGDFEKMSELFKRLGVKEWTVDIPCLEGNLRENPGFHLTPEEAGRFLSYGFGGGMHAGAEGYACGRHLMAVTADGNCAKCSFYADKPVGNINDGLSVCWGRVGHFRMEELACDCEHVESCRGGCRYRAELSGDPKGKDFYRCSYYDKIC